MYLGFSFGEVMNDRFARAGSTLLRSVRFWAFAAAFAPALAGCAADASDPGQGSSDEENVGESEDRSLSGKRLSETELADVVRTAGFPERMVGTMVCTAKYESNFYQLATHRNSNGSIDRGLFQINNIHIGGTRGCPKTADGLFDPAANARCAKAVYDAQGIRAWYGYRKHAGECDSYRVSSSGSPSSSSATSIYDDGGCWSRTLQDMTDARTCVQASSDQKWYQCVQGKWMRGGETGLGPAGKCSSRHPL